MIISKFWKELFQGRGKSRRRALQVTAPSQIERFEARCCPSVSSIFNVSTGELKVTATGPEDIAIGVDATGLVTLNGSLLTITNGGVTSTLAASLVTSIKVNGSAGNDHIDLSTVNSLSFSSLASVSVNTGDGNDVIVGDSVRRQDSGGERK